MYIDINMYIKSPGLYLKYPLFSSYLYQNWMFLIDFLKILKYQIPLKSVQWKPSCSMRTDERAGRTKLIEAFRNFATALKTGANEIRYQTQSEYTGSADSVLNYLLRGWLVWVRTGTRTTLNGDFSDHVHGLYNYIVTASCISIAIPCSTNYRTIRHYIRGGSKLEEGR
jgi:hypothetical protein